MEKVLEMPSRQSSYESLATLLSEASAPHFSRLCMGLAPGANGAPFCRPSGVVPVFLPYTTLLVMVSTDSVWMAPRYAGVLRNSQIISCSSICAMPSTRSSSLPKAGNVPVVSKSTM